MVLREAASLIAPPNDGVNENVAALEALAATRSVNAMLNAGLVTAVGQQQHTPTSSLWLQLCEPHPK